MVRFTSARIDERGRAYGGKAGDQTGKEVMSQDWYDRSWPNTWVVYRFKDPVKAELFAKAMEDAAKNDNIGYDQWERYDLYADAAKVGFDLTKVKGKTETDCSELVHTALAAAGIKTPRFRTSEEGKVLMATGEFEKLTSKEYIHSSKKLQRGDILCTRFKGHTGGITRGATPIPPPVQRVRVTGNSVNIRTGPGVEYSRIGVVSKGDTLEVTGKGTASWREVIFNGKVAYISKRYTEVLR